MIDIAKLTKSDIGRRILYQREYCAVETGTLSSWNHLYIFVRFKGPGGEACEPSDVSFYYDRIDNHDQTTR